MSDLVFQVDVETSEAVASINTFFDSFKSNAKTAGQALRQELGNPIETEVKLEFKNGKLVAKEVEKVKTASDKVLRAQKLINGEFKKTPKNLREQVRLLKNLRDNTTKYRDGTKRLNKDWVDLNRRIKNAKKELADINTQNPFASMAESLRGMTGRLTTANLLSNALQGAFNKTAAAVAGLVQEGLKMELLDLQLQGFTGSAGAAEEAMDNFIKTAVQTPLNVGEVANAGKTLLAFGLNADVAAEATHRLAIIAGATGGDMNNLSRNLGQISAQQRAYTRDLNQFATQGIPIYEELSRVLGVTVQDVRKMAEDGKIGFNEVQQAIQNMTKEGSAFAQIADEMQNTWTGQIEAMQSSIQVFAKEFVKFLKEMDDSLGGPFQNSLKVVSGSLKLLADNIGVVKAALQATTVAILAFAAAWIAINFGAVISAIRLLATAFVAIAAKIWAAVTATAAFQALTGPAGIIALTAGVAAFGVAMAKLRQEQDLTTKSLEGLDHAVAAEGEELVESAKKKSAYGEKLSSVRNKAQELRERIEELKEAVKRQAQAGYDTLPTWILIAKAKQELIRTEKELQRLLNSGNPAIQKAQQELLLAQDYLQYLEERLGKEQKVADEAKARLDEEKAKTEELIEASNEYYDEQIAKAEEARKVVQDKISDEERRYRELAEEKRKNDEEEIGRIETKYDKAIEAIEAQLGILGQQSPLEKELADLERQKLIEKINSGELDKEELLRAKIRLERMDKEVVRQKLLAEQAQLRKQREDEIEAAKQRQKNEDEKLEKLSEDKIDQLKKELTEHDNIIARLKDRKARVEENLRIAIDGAKKRFKTEEEISDALLDQIMAIDEAKKSYDKAKKSVDKLKGQLQETAGVVNKLKLDLQDAINLEKQLPKRTPSRERNDRRGTGVGSRFAGGPVSGGSPYTVNELGREAFLSASGKLSMINAPAWGKWKAPSDGTVIPAHLTKQLEIPSGGVNLNNIKNTMGGSRATEPSMAHKLIKAFSGLGGDSVTNNVTIQSANTRQTASDVMVQLAKLKRVRYS